MKKNKKIYKIPFAWIESESMAYIRAEPLSKAIEIIENDPYAETDEDIMAIEDIKNETHIMILTEEIVKYNDTKETFATVSREEVELLQAYKKKNK